MIVETRKTAQGTEYWDNKVKRSLFVPAGKKPPFDVTTEYDSMIGGIDLASGKDLTVFNEINLDDMDKEQLLAFAKQNDIKVPGNVSKEDTIRKHIEEQLTAADE